MREKVCRIDALLRAKEHDLRVIHDHLRADNDCAQREALQHQHDVIAFQAEDDRLSQEHQDRMAHFQRGEIGVLPALTVSAKLPPSASPPLGAKALGECCISLSAFALSSSARDPRRRSSLLISTG